MSIQRATGLLIATLLAPAPALAGAWTQPAGEAYAKIWARAIIGDHGFLADGGVEPIGVDFIDASLNLYLEYGLSEAITLVVSGNPAGFAKAGDSSTGYSGTLRLGARHALSTGPIRLAAELFYGVAPGIGEIMLAGGAVNGAQFTYIPTYANHQGGGELSIGWGHPYGWLAASAGTEFNGADALDHALYAFAQAGLSLSFGLVADVHLTWRHNLGEIEVANVSGAGPTRYVGWGVGLGYWITESVGISLGFDGAAMAQANAATPSFTLGIELR